MALPQRVYLLGVGGLGSTIAHQLCAAGHEVILLVRQTGDQPATITLEENSGAQTSASFATQASSGDGPPIDRLIVTTKAYDVAQALSGLRGRLQESSGIVMIHNGLVTAPLQDIVPQVSPANLWNGISMSGSVLKRGLPAVVTRWASPEGALLLGPLFPSGQASAPSQSLIDILLACPSLKADVLDGPTHRRWSRKKLAINATINPISGLMNVPNGACLGTSSFPTLVSLLCVEAAAVFKAEQDAAGEPLHPDLSADQLTSTALRIIGGVSAQISSTVQDIRAGRRTEIDNINGALSALGRKYRVPTPAHDLVCHLVATGLRSMVYSASIAQAYSSHCEEISACANQPEYAFAGGGP